MRDRSRRLAAVCLVVRGHRADSAALHERSSAAIPVCLGPPWVVGVHYGASRERGRQGVSDRRVAVAGVARSAGDGAFGTGTTVRLSLGGGGRKEDAERHGIAE